MEYKSHPNFDFHFPRHFILNSNFYVQNIEDNEKLMRITFPKKKNWLERHVQTNQPKDICPFFNYQVSLFHQKMICHFPESSSSTSTLCHHIKFFKKKPISSAHNHPPKPEREISAYAPAGDVGIGRCITHTGISGAYPRVYGVTRTTRWLPFN